MSDADVETYNRASLQQELCGRLEAVVHEIGLAIGLCEDLGQPPGLLPQLEQDARGALGAARANQKKARVA